MAPSCRWYRQHKAQYPGDNLHQSDDIKQPLHNPASFSFEAALPSGISRTPVKKMAAAKMPQISSSLTWSEPSNPVRIKKAATRPAIPKMDKIIPMILFFIQLILSVL